MNNLTADALRGLTVSERRELILQQAASVPAAQIADRDLQTAYKISQALSPVICPYIQAQVELDRQNSSILEEHCQAEAIQSEVEKFVADFNEWLKGTLEVQKAVTEKAPTNLYELAGAKRLASSNAVTRNLSTKMGHLWERLAKISPYAVSPTLEFGISIRGIDIIFCAEDQPVFAQLKSQRNTLTGAQLPRVKQELELHEQAMFIAAFAVGNWTFSHPTIPRIAGEQFWQQIHMDYALLEHHVKAMLQRLDQAFADWTNG